MLTCKQVTRMLSEAQDRPLTLGERISLKMHLLICKGCDNFGQQMRFLRNACRSYPGAVPTKTDRDSTEN